jgi:excinuclease UvrABC nuclease subunit
MATHLDELRMEARALPPAPGVYFWKDARQRILYIGKAVNLRSRVLSYFSAARHDRRTRSLLIEARSIGFEVTSTELEALFRESALIKREQPRFNRALKRSRAAYHIKLDTSRRDPYTEVARQVEDDGALYFGPFPTAAMARETLAYVHAVLPLRKCAAARPRCRPCMYFQMHTCAAPALDEEHRQRHEEAIQRLFDLLDGRHDRVVDWLQQKRDHLSQLLLFERAAEVQQRLDALGDVQRQQSILQAAMQCRSVLILDRGATSEGTRVLLVSHGHVLSARSAAGLSCEQLVRWVKIHEPVIAAAVLDQSDVDSATVLKRWIRSHRDRVRWVAIPDCAQEEELADRVAYLVAVDAQ